MVAVMCEWSEQAKLVNLVMHLRGPAYSFYHLCSPDQRANYGSLVAALARRFTQVILQAVQATVSTRGSSSHQKLWANMHKS